MIPLSGKRLSGQLLNKKKKEIKFGLFEKHSKFEKKNPHGFDKSADLLSKRQNHKEDFFKICVLLRKSKLYQKKALHARPHSQKKQFWKYVIYFSYTWKKNAFRKDLDSIFQFQR